MRELLDQIDAASAAGSHFIALLAALTVPDVAGALSVRSQRASEPQYRKWVEENLTEWQTRDQSLSLWKYRCSLLHQHVAQPDARAVPRRLIFVEPGYPMSGAHYTIADNIGPEHASGLIINTARFVDEVTTAARAWLTAHEHDEPVASNLRNTVQRRPNGWPPIVVGTPVIC